jgi:BlaI family transcriptional regulator, penicillinase repressor
MAGSEGFHLPGRRELSRREAQIMEIIYRRGSATAADVHARMPDAPSYSTVRKQLEVLEEKGHISHSVDGRRYVYTAVVDQRDAAQSAARQLLTTFFGGSASELMAALLSESDGKIAEEELTAIVRLAERARAEGR